MMRTVMMTMMGDGYDDDPLIIILIMTVGDAQDA